MPVKNRTATLAEIASRTLEGGQFGALLADFLDGFYAMPEAEAIAEEPAPLQAVMDEEGALRDAYLAAVAEHLAHQFRLPFPRWASDPRRSLRRPWFACDFPSLRATLIHESPAAFRCRNLFVSANALSRA
jgi:hypothetical protein